MKKDPLPSPAQARTIASLWGSNRPNVTVAMGDGAWVEPTTAVLIKRGWLVPNGEAGSYPSGQPWAGYKLADSAADALAAFLLQQRYKRVA